MNSNGRRLVPDLSSFRNVLDELNDLDDLLMLETTSESFGNLGDESEGRDVSGGEDVAKAVVGSDC